MKAVAWAAWPAGLVLTFAYAEARVIPLPVFLLLDLAYAALAVYAFRRLRATATAALLATPGVLIFSVASFTGAPTAREPGLMLANAAVLLVAAGVLLAGSVVLAARVFHGAGRAPALLAVAALTVGTAVYVANLTARFAIVLAGAGPAQAAVEDRAWQAYAYLRGLDGEPAPLTLLLVWLDLLQVAYVVLAYLAVAGLAVAAGRAGLVGATSVRSIAGAGIALTISTVLAAALGTVPVIGAAASGIAFALTIPFMSTLLPALLGASMADRADDGRLTGRSEAQPTARPAGRHEHSGARGGSGI